MQKSQVYKIKKIPKLNFNFKRRKDNVNLSTIYFCVLIITLTIIYSTRLCMVATFASIGVWVQIQKIHFLSILPQFFACTSFSEIFGIKNWNSRFDQYLKCTSPKPWSKYTTSVIFVWSVNIINLKRKITIFKLGILHNVN